MTTHTYFFNKNKVFPESEGAIGISPINNVNMLKKHPENYVSTPYFKFCIWNKKQKEADAWWIADDVYYKLIKLVKLFGYDLANFEVLIPKKQHPVLFKLNGMCLIAAPYVGVNFGVNLLDDNKSTISQSFKTGVE